MKKKDSLFMNEDGNGLIEIYFTEEELLELIGVLSLTKQICTTAAINSNEEESAKNVLFDKAQLAADLIEKLMIDANPGAPKGDLH